VTSLSDLPLRADLVGREPYGAPQLNVSVALNVNENTHRIPEEAAVHIVERLAETVLSVNRYPDREFTALREALAGYIGRGVTTDQVWAGNGSNEVLQHIFQAFGGPGRTSLSFTPSYSMYPLIAEGSGTGFIAEPRGERFTLNADAVAEAIRKHKPNIVLICSPNNPTGTPVDIEVIEAAYSAVEETGGVLVVDEAYAEFAHDTSVTAINLLPGRPRLLVSRTMSKAFAFAGARVGYLLADPAVIDALRLVRLPYHLSAFTQAAAEGALAHASALLANVDSIRQQRDRIVSELRAMGLDVFDSDANFVLFGGLKDPAAIWQRLLDRDVLVRNVGIPGTLRVTAGTPSETTAFLLALEAALADA
jgi:histidinol-phosphate aminotransferase